MVKLNKSHLRYGKDENNGLKFCEISIKNSKFEKIPEMKFFSELRFTNDYVKRKREA